MPTPISTIAKVVAAVGGFDPADEADVDAYLQTGILRLPEDARDEIFRFLLACENDEPTEAQVASLKDSVMRHVALCSATDKPMPYRHRRLDEQAIADLTAQGVPVVAQRLDSLTAVRDIVRGERDGGCAESLAALDDDIGRLRAWLEATAPCPIRAFLHDLAELSRRHGLWITGTGNALPHLTRGWGDESGYVPYNRFRGHVSDVVFDVISETEAWMRAPEENRGPAPEALVRCWNEMGRHRAPDEQQEKN